ncbi:tetratricopeptide repeat protein [Candidatus Saccharibacteria bacterium]|nr:tetratricopeptide repeat protein [Candidatus Saccharibacteria bacterium]
MAKKTTNNQLSKEHKAAKQIVSASKHVSKKPHAKQNINLELPEQQASKFSKKNIIVGFLALGSFFGLLTLGSVLAINHNYKNNQKVILSEFNASQADVLNNSQVNDLLAYSIDPAKDYQGAFLQAKVFFEQQNYAEATKKYEQIVAVNPSDLAALENYAYSLVATNDSVKAKTVMSKAIELTKDSSQKKQLQAKLNDIGSE